MWRRPKTGSLLTHSRLRTALVLVAIVVGAGTLAFMLTEPWGLWDAFYFTIVTISTVGYGDYDITPAGQRVAILLMLSGIGVLTYAVSQVIQATIELSLNTERKMYEQIALLRDHVIVCGLGRMGRIVCRELAQADTPFVVIETDEALVEEAQEAGWLVHRGDATTDEALECCGVERASSVVCAVSSDNINIVTTLTARDLCPKVRIISRADCPTNVRKIQRAGATEVISPIWVGARRITDVILDPNSTALLDTSELSTSPIRLHEHGVTPEDPIAGKSVRAVGADHPAIVFVAVQRADGSPRTRPEPDYVFSSGDDVVVAGETEDLAAFDLAIRSRAAA